MDYTFTMKLNQLRQFFIISSFLFLLGNFSPYAQAVDNQQPTNVIQSKNLFQQIKEALNALLDRQKEANRRMTELREQAKETIERNKEAMQQARENQQRSQLLQKQQIEDQKRMLEAQKDLLLRQRR